MQPWTTLRAGIIALCSLLSRPEAPAQVALCHTEQVNPQSPGSRQAFERWLQQTMQVAAGAAMRSDSVITLPIVFHLLHNGEPIGQGRNLSADRVAAQLAVLHEDFRRKPGTPGFNTHPAGADAGIEFCPVMIGPDGLPLAEPGIHRIDRNAFGWALFPYTATYMTTTVMPLTIWDPERYLNVWVAELVSGVIGFAQYPDAPLLQGLNFPADPETDGIVVATQRFGRGGAALPPYHLGRTLTHEMGHFLGLRHTWGDGDCSADDFCEDTPPASQGHFGCPSQALDCGVPVQLNNYLEYTDDACMNLFTQCQRARMRTVLQYSPRRASLTGSLVCRTDLPPSAAFSASTQQVCPGGAVIYRSVSARADSLQWSFPGGVPATATGDSVAVQYFLPGIYSAALIAKNAFGSDTLGMGQAVTVSATLADVLTQDFENGWNGWTVHNPDGAISWDLAQTAGSRYGPAAARMRMYDYNATGQRDALISPAVNLNDYTQAVLRFDYAHRIYNLSAVDTLRVWLSGDDGLTYSLAWTGAENGQGNFATGPPLTAGFTPIQANDWCHNGDSSVVCVEINWPVSQIGAASRVKFETTNQYGNNLFLDGIQIRGFCQATRVYPLAGGSAYALYPNPLSGRFTLEGPTGAPVTVFLLAADGRQVFQSQPVWPPSEVQLPGLPDGIYLAMVREEGGKPLFFQKIRVAQ